MNADRMMAYLKAKGLSYLLPALSGNGHMFETVIDKLKEGASAKALENVKSQDPEKRQKVADSMGMFFEMVKRNLPRLSTNTQRKLAFNMFFNHLTLGQEARDRYRGKYGEPPPFLLVISPSMRCNLNCFGCYAWEYNKSKELTREEVSEVIRQAKEELGIYFITISGGEPTIWPHLFEILEEHNDVFFQIYTHGMMIDDVMAKKMGELGNVHPAISIEGGPKETNERRGEQAYDKILASMDRLNREGVLFGFSVTHTRKNHHAVTSDEFIEEMLKHGPSFGWFFQYVPTGKKPDPSLVPTPAQRLERYAAVERFRRTKPILVYDFWNDGEATEGCLAWGRKYLHVTASGMVEPCVFIHMALDSIREKSLVEILNSPCFKEARSMQPFNEDHRRPCCIIDNCDVLPYLCRKYTLVPTHDGAERIVTDLHEALARNAEAYRQELERQDAGASVHPAG
ncbi:MAG: radical SAM protein [Candidatus Abyssobacteria bacterium SURF_17]|uniref:Radical SAM protein n=1 Tax=Candidatus Abyssobacteria bacterium SURF_17 TaxID=2093361 RepID=A0A419EXC0_9BACT|nr:MAG: radical SAM protein [Candidatus Abyssubacteria bacterium SURF_17]